MKFDPTGKLVTSFGAGMFNFPHGLGVDREGNVYVTDERAKNGKGVGRGQVQLRTARC